MYRYRHIYSVAAFALLAAALLLSFWPLGLAGLFLAAATGRYGSAVCIGLIQDVLYSAPIGHWHFVYAPFTLLALVLCALHYFLSAYFREGGSNTL